MNKYLLSFFSFVLLITCSKIETIEPPIIDDSNPNDPIIWQIPLGIDSAEYLSLDVSLLEDGVLASSQALNISQNETIFMVKKENGEKIWQWNDYVIPSVGQTISEYSILDETIFLNSGSDLYGIDKNNGTTIWSFIREFGMPRSSTFENLIFHPQAFGVWPRSEQIKVSFSPINANNWKEIISIYKEGDYEVFCNAPSVYLNQEQDTIIIFHVNKLRISPADNKVDLYAYNMTQDTFVWKKLDFDPTGEANIRPPLIDGDYVYHVGFKEVFCINKYTGETIWQWGFPDLPFGFLSPMQLLSSTSAGCSVKVRKYP
jgi:outer membrane protein assembly factor BamB